MGRFVLFLIFSVPIGSLACDLLAKLKNGEPIVEITIVTHPFPVEESAGDKHNGDRNYEDQLVTQLENSPTYENSPILMIGMRGAWQIPKDRLPPGVKRRTVQADFDDGSLKGITVNAKTIHLAGGACGACLSRTFNSILKDFEKNERKSIEVNLHLDITYGVDVPRQATDEATEQKLPKSAADAALIRLLSQAQGDWTPAHTGSIGGLHTYRLTSKSNPEKHVTFTVSYEASWDD